MYTDRINVHVNGKPTFPYHTSDARAHTHTVCARKKNALSKTRPYSQLFFSLEKNDRERETDSENAYNTRDAHCARDVFARQFEKLSGKTG